MKRIKIAQIGFNTNSHSREIWNSITRQNDIFETVGFVLAENERERLPEKIKGLNEYPELSLEQVLNNPEIEAVTVETDEIYLTKYALLAAKAGKHIHMEKPGGMVLSDFEELINTVKKSGKVFHTGYMYRYNPFVKDLLKRIKSGEIGEIISVEAQMNCCHTKEVRQWLQSFPGGMMFFLGCHLIDLILSIKGMPERIIPLNKCSGVNGVKCDDFGMAVFEYKDGVSFAKTSAVEIGGFARRQLVVSGTKGTIELKPLEMFAENGKQYTAKTEYRLTDWGNMGEDFKTEPFDRYDSMMTSFAEYIRGEKENPYSPDYELKLYKTILKCCGVNVI